MADGIKLGVQRVNSAFRGFSAVLEHTSDIVVNNQFMKWS